MLPQIGKFSLLPWHGQALRRSAKTKQVFVIAKSDGHIVENIFGRPVRSQQLSADLSANRLELASLVGQKLALQESQQALHSESMVICARTSVVMRCCLLVPIAGASGRAS